MARQRSDKDTLDLLAWEPPEPVRSFPADKVRAASLRAAVSKGLALALGECGKSRDEIAEEASEYLGEELKKSMLDAYASEAREDHVINVVRFVALVHATRDFRLLQMLAEPFGLAVIDARYLPAIEEAVLADKIEELTQRRVLSRKKWRGA